MTKSSNAFASQGLGSGREGKKIGRRESKKAKCRLGQAGGQSRETAGRAVSTSQYSTVTEESFGTSAGCISVQAWLGTS
jgi:hypothetical protein